jgi:hypothetical protein
VSEKAKKKVYLKKYLERSHLAVLKAGASLHLIKSNPPANVKSNFLINSFIYQGLLFA